MRCLGSRLAVPPPEPAAATVHAAFEALAGHDVEALLGCLHPEVEVVPAAGGPDLGDRGRGVCGHDGVRRWFAEVIERWPFYRATLLEARPYGADDVVAEGTLVVNPPRGAGFGSFAGWIFSFDGGRIRRAEAFLSRAALADALTARSASAQALCSRIPES